MTYTPADGFTGLETLTYTIEGENGCTASTSVGYLYVAVGLAGFTSRVQVLEQDGQLLSVIGQTESLAPGERIHSTRFVDNRAYVVTFRQIDPLFTVDLSNPEQPTVTNELKMPGFSQYLHSIGDVLYSVSSTEIQAHSLNDPSRPLIKRSLRDLHELAEPTVPVDPPIADPPVADPPVTPQQEETMVRIAPHFVDRHGNAIEAAHLGQTVWLEVTAADVRAMRQLGVFCRIHLCQPDRHRISRSDGCQP